MGNSAWEVNVLNTFGSFHPFSVQDKNESVLTHTGTNIGARYSPAFFNAFFCVHTQAIFADDEPSEHANSFPDIRWRLM